MDSGDRYVKNNRDITIIFGESRSRYTVQESGAVTFNSCENPDKDIRDDTCMTAD
jgi:hypothetical protein